MKKLLFATAFLLIISPFLVFIPSPVEGLAQDEIGSLRTFFTEKAYDMSHRTRLEAILVKISPQLYFYIENDWWQGLKEEERERVRNSLNQLTEEFEGRIYPVLTQTFGKEWSPGIDNDTRITILVHQMPNQAGGYFKNGDEYPKIQFPESNEREIVYLNAKHIANFELSKAFLAHEFMHLISFNQKEKRWGAVDDVWLQEARSEYAPTLLGYDKNYEGSNLQRRVRNFIDKPFDSLTEWRGEAGDYGVVNLFTQYLVDHYGLAVLRDSLSSDKAGIASINEVLKKNNFQEDFSRIFADWTVAVLMNDCDLGSKYCYKNEQLKNLKITPLINFLPFIGESTLSVNNTTRDWAGNWHKFIGGNGELKVDFKGEDNAKFKVPYIIETDPGKYSVGLMQLDENNDAKITISDFGEKNLSFVLIPITQTKTSDFAEIEPSRSFFWLASTVEKGFVQPKPQITRADILAKIAEIQKLIADLQAQLLALTGSSKISCQAINNDLYYGLMNNGEVRCLQEFLRDQGPDIYQEGLATGNFLTLTELAVVRFQEKYAAEILTPLGFIKGTGFVGSSTRAKINQLMNQ